jgi:glycosyltransferase involved in cell wall biosynthesis
MPQISFVVRVHNEEATLRESITSLFPIEKPIEIVVILHRCTDDSKVIALACQVEAPARHRVKIVEYEVPISRAGLETFVTPVDSPYSIMSYYNWAFSQASSAWRFKWDSDFVATPGFIRWINGRDWSLQDSRALNVPHRSPDGTEGREPYASNCLRHFVKQDFWEVPMFPSDFVLEEVPDDAAFVHASRLGEVKPYWHNDPWFFDGNVDASYSAEAATLRDAYERAVKLVGPEPIGVARSDNPECDAYLERCRKMLHPVQNGSETVSP